MTKIICLAAFALISASAFGASQPTNNAVRLDASRLLVTIEWRGPMTKPVYDAAWGTTNCIAALRQWKVQNSGFRFVTIISQAEATELTNILSAQGGLRKGSVESPVTQGYVLNVTSGTDRYQKHLLFSKELLPLLQQVKGCLAPQSRYSVEKIMTIAKGWQE